MLVSMGGCCTSGNIAKKEPDSASNSNFSETKDANIGDSKTIRILSSQKRPLSRGSDNTDANSYTNIPLGDDFGTAGETSILSNVENNDRSCKFTEGKQDCGSRRYSWRNSICGNDVNNKNRLLSLRSPLVALQHTSTFIKSLKSVIPNASLKSSIMELNDRFPKILPYISGAALGFSKISKTLNDPTKWHRPRRNKRQHVLPQDFRPLMASTSHLIKDPPLIVGDLRKEHLGWWRYTMFLLDNTDDIQGFSIKGTALIGLENRTGCEIKLSENRFTHRGRTVRQVFIDGPSQIAVMRCKSSLPRMMQRRIIQDTDEPFRGEFDDAVRKSKMDSNLVIITTAV